ncbi:MAG: ornithine carbamoyltransferase [Thermoplasmatota archaeon]
MKKDILSMIDLRDEVPLLLEMAANIKEWHRTGQPYEPLRGKTLAMIFEKPSTRTRVSFETGITQLGGHAIYLSPGDTQLGRGETLADTARTLSRYVDVIAYRAFDWMRVRELAESATVPVINALDNREHPCQIMADLMTIKEHKGALEKLRLAYVGDGNNVCNSLLLGAAISGMEMRAACPRGYWPDRELHEYAVHIARETGCEVDVLEDPREAVEEADIVYTDVWVSMGEEDRRREKEELFLPYQVNAVLLARAKRNCIVMHCLPAHRGLEITDEVIDGPQSVVFDQAENRLHMQKAILSRLVG